MNDVNLFFIWCMVGMFDGELEYVLYMYQNAQISFHKKTVWFSFCLSFFLLLLLLLNDKKTTLNRFNFQKHYEAPCILRNEKANRISLTFAKGNSTTRAHSNQIVDG